MAFNFPTGTVVKRTQSTRLSTFRGITPTPNIRVTRDDSFNTTKKSSVGNKSRSLEALNNVEKEPNPLDVKYDAYNAAYNRYLGKKLLAKMLLDDKDKKQEQVSKCLVSLKLEYEESLNKNINLKKDLMQILTYSENIVELNKHIDQANVILKVLKQSNFDLFLNDRIIALDRFLNQIRLVDISEDEFKEMFEKNILGCNSNIYKTLTRMHNYVKEHADVIAGIGKQCEEIEALHDKVKELRMLSSQAAQSSLSNSVKKNYLHFFALATEGIKDEGIDSWKPVSSSTPGDKFEKTK